MDTTRVMYRQRRLCDGIDTQKNNSGLVMVNGMRDGDIIIFNLIILKKIIKLKTRKNEIRINRSNENVSSLWESDENFLPYM